MFADTTMSAFSAPQVKASCLAMLEVARANGIAPAELDLIRSFWVQADQPLGDFDHASSAPFAAELFVEDSHKQLLLDLCLACAFADGKYSPEEKAVIAALAAKLGIAEPTLVERTAEVRAAFLGSLAHLPDAQSVAALAKNLE